MARITVDGNRYKVSLITVDGIPRVDVVMVAVDLFVGFDWFDEISEKWNLCGLD